MFQSGLTSRREVFHVVCCLIILVILVTIIGCNAVVDAPSMSPDGTIQGGAPKLSALIHMISTNRPRPLVGAPQGATYTITIFPVRHMCVLEGELPETKEAIGATYTIIASLDSADSAEIAVVTETFLNRDLSLRSRSGAFRWEKERWVARSFGELHVTEPIPNRESAMSPQSQPAEFRWEHGRWLGQNDAK
jgi:hypothetical protein